jgi:glycosyltransferase involved in cell wall biosynthesis
MIDCTVLIMTFNEEDNIKECLDSVSDSFKRVCIVDSFSTDDTLKIAADYKDVDIYSNEFESWGLQRNWIFKKANVTTKYVLFLDADEVISQSLNDEIACCIEAGKMDNAKFYVKNIFLGKWIRFSYGHPAIVRLFRTSSSPSYTAEGAREYPDIKGTQVVLQNPLIHFDRKPLDVWLTKHISNARREALYLLEQSGESTNNTFKSFIRNNIWVRLPIFFRSLLYFLYRYFLKLGFLDGAPGFIFCFFQAFSYQNMISAFIYEKKRKNKY